MTDEERKKLLSTLRSIAAWQGLTPVREAADEIERLEKEVARLKDEYGVLLERTTNMLDMTVR
jgi:HAMP domain-containing protein